MIYCIHVPVVYTIIFVQGNSTHHFVMLSFILILQSLWPTNMEILMLIFSIEILMLHFLNENAKEDVFQCFIYHCASHLAYFQVYGALHVIWGWILIEKSHILNQRNMYSAIPFRYLCQLSEILFGFIQKFVSLM